MDNLDGLLEGFFQDIGRPGKIWVLNHLRSEKGQAMNGRRVVVVGLDPPSATSSILNRRIRVRFLDPNDSSKPVGKVLQIKPRNLVSPQDYSSVIPEPTLSEEVAIKFLKQAYANGLAQGHDQLVGSPDETRDRSMRMKLIQKQYLLSKETISTDDSSSSFTKSECMDPLIPPEEQNGFELMKSATMPACIGDGYVDFRRFGEGIISAQGQEMECAICQEQIQDDLIRLPCNHRFHLGCIKPWVEKENTCPTCRQELKHSLDTYAFPDIHRQIQNRFDEWFISGMCERCQARYMEDDPIVTVTKDDGTEVTMPLSVAKSYGFTEYKSVQGQAMETLNLLPG